jgi:hypothetical protein
MKKFRASMETFWDLKISKYYVELCRVTYSVLPCSLTSIGGRTSRVFLIPRILCHYVPIRSSKAALRCQVRLYD